MNIFEDKNTLTRQYNKILRGEISHGGLLLQSLIEQSPFAFDHGAQQDAHEGLMLLIDALGDDIKKVFSIKHNTKSKCTCGFRNSNKGVSEIFIDYYCNSSCFNPIFFHQQFLPNDYKCDSCKKLSTTRMSKRLYSISDIIIVTFKKSINQSQISFPTEIILSPTLRFELVAQIEHFGTTNGGHYIARARRPTGIYLFNDSFVTESTFQPTPNTLYAILSQNIIHYS